MRVPRLPVEGIALNGEVFLLLTRKKNFVSETFQEVLLGIISEKGKIEKQRVF